MPDPKPEEPTTPSETDSSKADAAPPKSAGRRRRATKTPPKEATPPPKEEEKEEEVEEGPRAPRRPTLDAQRTRLLGLRDQQDRHRPLFVRQAAHRYFRIGRWESWRRPRGLQSKQRRHYGYRSEVVSVGYRSPARIRGLTPSGFRPVLVQTSSDVEKIDAKTEAAVIARTVGTRRRLALEEIARKLGIHVLNPLVKSEAEA
ncbi:MAG: 50S ribosomal protein L32e [Thermoplasmata archaeon]|jgi:large subunit ribosomal protein L32e